MCSDRVLWINSFPNLKKEWNWRKNNKLKLYPEKLSSSSNKKVYWICSKNPHHEWESTINSRTGKFKSGCPCCVNRKICCDNGCNSVYFSNPKLQDEWDAQKNGEMKTFFPNSGKLVSWICSENPHHKWKSSIDKRSGKDKTGCPCCANQKICCDDGCNSVYFSNPELRDEWDDEKNGEMKRFFKGSNRKVWWICSENPHHKWEAIIANRTGKHKTGCPCCNQSKLEKELSEACKNLNLNLVTQKKYEDTKNIRYLPYDGCINGIIDIELQGVQHFQLNRYTSSLTDRIITDTKKCINSYRRGHRFISISYICIEYIEDILSEFIKDVNKKQTIRFYITKDTFLDFEKDTPKINLEDDNILSIFSVYDFQLKNIEKEEKVKISKCIYCNNDYLEPYIDIHYKTKNHIEMVKEQLGELVFSITEDGIPIAYEE